MKILAVDTATTSVSVALMDGGTLCTEITRSTGETHARHLMTLVDTALNQSGMAIVDLDGFGVTIGPGTFTGLRIGLSSIQGMAAAVSKPVVGISSLDALAAQAAPASRETGSMVWAMLDARRQEVYGGLFKPDGSAVVPVSAPQVGQPEVLVDDTDTACVFVGSGALFYQDVLREKLADRFVLAAPLAHTIRGETIARLAQARLENQAVPIKRVLQPVYLRKSDAEIHQTKQAARK
jgi:tRNA threonylcarbamoyladenosine biosynthesis protein TsaB